VNNIHKIITTTLIILATTACSNVEEVNSSDIASSEMWARFEVFSTEDNTATARASLLVGGSHSNTHINITGGDKLEVFNGTNVQTVVKDPTSSKVVYVATFDHTNSGRGNTNYRFDFSRDEHRSATNSIVSLPIAVNKDNILFNPSSSFSRSTEAVTVTWDGIEDSEVDLQITGNCIQTYSKKIPDTGEFTINANSIKSNPNQPGGSCQLTFKFTRTNTGTVDDAFGEGGEIHAYSSREATLLTTQ